MHVTSRPSIAKEKKKRKRDTETNEKKERNENDENKKGRKGRKDRQTDDTMTSEGAKNTLECLSLYLPSCTSPSHRYSEFDSGHGEQMLTAAANVATAMTFDRAICHRKRRGLKGLHVDGHRNCERVPCFRMRRRVTMKPHDHPRVISRDIPERYRGPNPRAEVNASFEQFVIAVPSVFPMDCTSFHVRHGMEPRVVPRVATMNWGRTPTHHVKWKWGVLRVAHRRTIVRRGNTWHGFPQAMRDSVDAIQMHSHGSSGGGIPVAVIAGP